MEIDGAARAQAIGRAVQSGERDGRPTKVVVARSTYAAEIADVWEALTDPDRLPRWFLPVSGELREGGRYQLEGNAGGTIEVCARPELLRVTWEYGGGVSWLQVRLSPHGPSGTDLELRHEAPVDDHWGTYGPGAVGIGWDMAQLGLLLHLGSGEAVDPQEAQAWFATPPGVAFVTASSDGWGEADVEGGAEPEAARAAAARTTAAYTGAAPEG